MKQNKTKQQKNRMAQRDYHHINPFDVHRHSIKIDFAANVSAQIYDFLFFFPQPLKSGFCPSISSLSMDKSEVAFESNITQNLM